MNSIRALKVGYQALMTRPINWVENQPRSQGLFPGLGAGREKTLASAGHVSILHPEILGVIN